MENLAYQEEYKEEILNGEIVLMSPSPTVNHNRIVINLSRIFSNFLRGKQCEAFSDGVDLYLSEKDRVIPDMMVVCNPNIIKEKGIYGSPDLIVEILSPSTAKNDKGYKKQLYEKSGIKEYWIISPKEHQIEVYLLKDGKYELDNVYTGYAAHELEDMTEKEKSDICMEFKCSLYDDLIISVEKVFARTF